VTGYNTVEVPADWDIVFLANSISAQKPIGYDRPDDGSVWTIRYSGADVETVDAAIQAYPVNYANEVLKGRMWDEVKAIRDQKETADAPTPIGHAIQTDEASKAKILGVALTAALGLIDELTAASMAGRPFDPANLTFSEQFTMADNFVADLDTFSAIAVAKSAGGYVSQVYARARALRDQIEAAANIDDLALIDIHSGWPDAG
jgi:hypothetical protein